jgi:hypothetical protein
MVEANDKELDFRKTGTTGAMNWVTQNYQLDLRKYSTTKDLILSQDKQCAIVGLSLGDIQIHCPIVLKVVLANKFTSTHEEAFKIALAKIAISIFLIAQEYEISPNTLGGRCNKIGLEYLGGPGLYVRLLESIARIRSFLQATERGQKIEHLLIPGTEIADAFGCVVNLATFLAGVDFGDFLNFLPSVVEKMKQEQSK